MDPWELQEGGGRLLAGGFVVNCILKTFLSPAFLHAISRCVTNLPSEWLQCPPNGSSVCRVLAGLKCQRDQASYTTAK